MATNDGGFIGQDGLNAPDSPTGVSATAGDAQADVSFTAPSDVGGSAITGYRAQSNDGIGASGSSSPITVTGLTNGTSYTFNVWAINAFGYSAPSHASGSVSPSAPIGLFFGGLLPSTTDIIQKLFITTSANATDFGNLTQARYSPSAYGSSTRGVCSAGNNGSVYTNIIDYVTFATEGDATDFGDTTLSRAIGDGFNSDTRGVDGGGFTGSTPFNTIDYVTIASTGNATDFGDLTTGKRSFCGSASSPTRGLWFAGFTGATTVQQIDYVTIASTGNALDFGDLALKSSGAACSNNTRALSFLGGNGVDVYYVTIASTGNAVDFGDLTANSQLNAAVSSQTKALFTIYNNVTVDQFTIASTGNATDYGDLVQNSGYFRGTSNANGGLS
jgi:hypothetical protein